MIFDEKQKTWPIEGGEVWEAFKEVRAGGESPGVDGITIGTVASKPRKYLYPVWNRLASGSYYPQAVRQAEIPKEDGSKRLLGIPTVTDRVAQMVIKWKLEKYTNEHFSANSFGYIEGKSQHNAVEQCRINCLKHRWEIDLDIKGFFDNIDHELLMRGVAWFTKEKYILMYVERWLKAPVLLLGGTIEERLNECKLELNRSKTKIVHCQNSHKRQAPSKEVKRSFDFLGYTFKPRYVMYKGKIRVGFTPAMSRKSQKRINKLCFKLKIQRLSHFNIYQIAGMLRSKTIGWINYYGKFRKSGMRGMFRVLNFRLGQWVRNKYRRFRKKPWYCAYKWLVEVSKDFPCLFIHWEHGFLP